MHYIQLYYVIYIIHNIHNKYKYRAAGFCEICVYSLFARKMYIIVSTRKQNNSVCSR